MGASFLSIVISISGSVLLLFPSAIHSSSIAASHCPDLNSNYANDFLSIAASHCPDRNSNYANDFLSIQNTLARYSLPIDTKDFRSLDQVFTSDVYANYSLLGVQKGLAKLSATIEQSLSSAESQHALTTQVLTLYPDGNTTTASAMTYFSIILFGRGVYEGETARLYGRYEDQLVKIGTEARDERDCDGPGRPEEWRIRVRQIILMGPVQGNSSILLLP